MSVCGRHTTASSTPRHGKYGVKPSTLSINRYGPKRADGRTPQRTPSSGQLHQHAQQQRFTTANHDSLCPMLPRPVVSRDSTPSYRRFRARSLARASSPSHTAKGPSTSIASIQATRRCCRRPRRLRVRPAHSVPANTHNRCPTVCKPPAAAFQKAMLQFFKSKFKGAC